MKNAAVKSIVVLTCICLVITLALAAVNHFTAPIIEENNAKANDAALKNVLEDAESFTELEIEGLPSTVANVYKGSGDSGYAMILSAKGYKGGEIRIAVGFDINGTILKVATIDCSSQTSGLGTKVGLDSFTSQFKNITSVDGVDTISGATISSRAYINAVNDAFTAFSMIKNIQE